MPDSIRYNCGEYLPGNAPVPPGGGSNSPPNTTMPATLGSFDPPFNNNPPNIPGGMTNPPGDGQPPIPGGGATISSSPPPPPRGDVSPGGPTTPRTITRPRGAITPRTPIGPGGPEQIGFKCEVVKTEFMLQKTPRACVIGTPGCVYRDSSEAIRAGCMSVPITPRNPITDPSNESQTQTNNSESLFRRIQGENSKSVNYDSNGSYGIISSNLERRNKEEFISSNNQDNLKRFASVSSASKYYTARGAYHPIYNFFKYTSNTETTVVQNNKYLDIFKSTIPYEVQYFLDKVNTSSPWDEEVIQNLTNDKLIASVHQSLLDAFNNIHYLGGKVVGLSYFLETLKKHLITGRLDEFDPYYYIKIYENQKSDPLVKITNNGNSANSNELAIGLLETETLISDLNRIDNQVTRNHLKRLRHLNTDINARLRIIQLEGYEYPLYLNDAGVSTVQKTDSNPPEFYSNLVLGDGAGYYFSTIDGNFTELPIACETDISSAYYIPPNIRSNILDLIGSNSLMNLTSESLSTGHEFSQSYNPSADINVMYFALDLTTVKDKVTNNSLVNTTSGLYRRLSDSDAIQHSKNYGFNVTKVNLDYRDPLIHYARDSSCVTLSQNDMNFRSFDVNRSPGQQSIITRGIPFALILTPGCGVSHNPLNGQSRLAAYDSSTIRRTISLSTHIDNNKNDTNLPVLDNKKIYQETGNFYHGLYEKELDQDPHGYIFVYNPSSSIFDKSYYYNGSYSNVQPPSSARTGSVESHLVLNIIDKLKTLYNPTDLTWWDVYRRLKIHEIGMLSYCNSKDLINNLSNQFRGIPIRDVISRANPKFTGIDSELDPSDLIIINEIDRINSKLIR